MLDSLLRQSGFISPVPSFLQVFVLPEFTKCYLVFGWKWIAVSKIWYVVNHIDIRHILGRKGQFHIDHCVKNAAKPSSQIYEDELTVMFNLGGGDRNPMD